jgi:hypothetical protein
MDSLAHRDSATKGPRVEQLRRADNPYRFRIPEDLVPRLRDLRSRQDPWSELIDAEDVVHLYYGLGPAMFLTLDGRVLEDSSDWDATGAHEVTDPKQAWSAVVVGAKVWGFPELLRLLPARPPKAADCVQCHGTGWVSWVDAEGKTGQVVCWDRCGGLGWLAEYSAASCRGHSE